MKLIRYLSRCACRAAGIVAAVWAVEAISFAQQIDPNFDCPDDGMVDIASIVAGTTDKTVTVSLANGSDANFKLEIYNPADPNTVLDSVVITNDNQPSITMPPGTKCKAADPQDSDIKRPKGTRTVT